MSAPIERYRTGNSEIDRAADALVLAQERAAERQRLARLQTYQRQREAYNLRVLEQKERDRPKTLVFVGFGVTLALGLLGCLAFIAYQIWQALTAGAAWVAANGALLLGGAIVLLLVLGLFARPAISIVQKVTIR